jgi:hypothetical protein
MRLGTKVANRGVGYWILMLDTDTDTDDTGY